MYFTFPIIEFSDTIDQTLQQNISDFIYRVFYSPLSEFKQGFDQGYSQGDLYNALSNSINDTVQNMETIKGYPYVIDNISIQDFVVIGDKVSCTIYAKSGSLELPANVTVTKSLL